MTTARALIRQRADMGGDLGEIVSDVNRQLAADVGASGRFMTLFYSRFDAERGIVRWARAGHDPAIFHDPSAALFEELGGRGLPLGVFERAEFEVCERRLPPGGIVLIGTDGIWETHNPAGEMLGKEAVCDIISREAHRSAEEILGAVIEAVEHFRGGVHQEDDITLVVVKAVAKGPGDPTC
jgi:sigma-B regulation protein RsbU (phosphoserine phosphatase)